MPHPARASFTLVIATLAALTTTACSVQDEQAQQPILEPYPSRVVVTADWLNRSLTIFDHARLVAGGTVDESRWATVDLAPYAPGPLEVEVTPDGKTAIVSVSPGFMPAVGAIFIGPVDVPPGGTLLLVDLPTRTVRAEIKTAQVPMGIAITPDGKEAFIADFGEESAVGKTISKIDVLKGVLLDELEVSGRPEQIALSADGSLGIVSLDGESTTRVFDPKDFKNTLSPGVTTSTDPSGVALAEGTNVGVVANSLGSEGYSTIDVSDPLAPVAIETVNLALGIPYAATRIPGTKHVLLGGATGSHAKLVRIDCGVTPAAVVDTISLDNSRGGFALSAAVDSDGKFAFVGIPGDNSLQVVDLSTKTARSLKWLTDRGPTYAAVQP